MRVFSDGNFLAVGSHDNFIYIYNVTDNGRRYSRFGKCNVGPKSRKLVQGQKEQCLMWSWCPDSKSGKKANDQLVAYNGLYNISEGVEVAAGGRSVSLSHLIGGVMKH